MGVTQRVSCQSQSCQSLCLSEKMSAPVFASGRLHYDLHSTSLSFDLNIRPKRV